MNLRLAVWWHHIVAPILGVFYVLLLLGNAHFIALFPSLIWFLVSILGTASLGYWINDWADKKQDQAVGKKNATIGYTLSQKWMVLIFLFLLAMMPWYFLPRHYLSIGLWALLLLSFVLYSVPPFRFKEKTILGILCDMAYGHLLPVWITIGTFIFLTDFSPQRPHYLTIIISLVLFLKGLRNIIQHQIEDRKKDHQLKLNTFVHWLGPYRSALLISFGIIPLETIALGLLLWQLHILFSLFFLFFLITYGWRMWSWKYNRARSIRPVFRLWFVLNDYYEASFPLSILLLLFFQHPGFAILGAVHLILFPKTLDHWKWVGKTWINLELWWELRKYIV